MKRRMRSQTPEPPKIKESDATLESYIVATTHEIKRLESILINQIRPQILSFLRKEYTLSEESKEEGVVGLRFQRRLRMVKEWTSIKLDEYYNRLFGADLNYYESLIDMISLLEYRLFAFASAVPKEKNGIPLPEPKKVVHKMLLDVCRNVYENPSLMEVSAWSVEELKRIITETISGSCFRCLGDYKMLSKSPLVNREIIKPIVIARPVEEVQVLSPDSIREVSFDRPETPKEEVEITKEDVKEDDGREFRQLLSAVNPNPPSTEIAPFKLNETSDMSEDESDFSEEESEEELESDTEAPTQEHDVAPDNNLPPPPPPRFDGAIPPPINFDEF